MTTKGALPQSAFLFDASEVNRAKSVFLLLLFKTQSSGFVCCYLHRPV